jgi:hypothetical protein
LLKGKQVNNCREKRVYSLIFVEKERNLFIKDEHQYKKRTDNKALGSNQGRGRDTESSKIIFLK